MVNPQSAVIHLDATLQPVCIKDKNTSLETTSAIRYVTNRMMKPATWNGMKALRNVFAHVILDIKCGRRNAAEGYVFS